MHRIPSLPIPHLLQFALAGFLVAAPFGATAQQPSPLDLARKNACMACHGLVHKQVGPGFAQIADRYRNDATAPVRLADKIRNGSVGTWGRVIMPRQSLVTEADAQVLARWVLAQQQPPAR
ncbi:c-type cytochrome [Variovorax sp. YR752]|uniref:c-type cytochrome n=1 Tax=Variovorax sp. YR752 TaxID=1884383 RepID=UPI003137CAC6